jgi:hypothetical protein
MRRQIINFYLRLLLLLLLALRALLLRARVFLNESFVPPDVFLLTLELSLVGAFSNGLAAPAAFATPAADQFARLKVPSGTPCFTAGNFASQFAIAAFSAFVKGLPVTGFMLEAILQVKNLMFP